MNDLEDRRIEFHNMLKAISGINNIYYQPPENLKMKFPAIVYNRNEMPTKKADNSFYTRDVGYSVTVIDSDPDSNIVNMISKMDKCRFVNHRVVSGLYHDSFIIYH